MKTLKKTLSVFLAILMCMSVMTAAMPVFASAKSTVNYPSRGVSDSDLARNATYYTSDEALQEVIDRIDGALQSEDFAKVTGMEQTLDKTVQALIQDNLYNDKFITDLIKTIYPAIVKMLQQAIEDNAEVKIGSITIGLRGKANDLVENQLPKFGLYLYPDNLANKIAEIDSTKFAGVISAFRNAGKNWDAVNWDTLKWGITNRDDWVKGLGCALVGVLPAVRALLQNVTYDSWYQTVWPLTVTNIQVRLQATANPGYEKTLLPLIETLCGNLPVNYTHKGVTYTSLMPASEYNKLTNPVDIAAHIALPIFTMVENIVGKMPVASLTEILPQLCYALSNGFLQKWLSSLQTTATFELKAYLGGALGHNKTITKNSFTLNTWDLVKKTFDGVDTTSLSSIANFALKDANLPEIDTEYLAGLGDESTFDSGNTRIVADKSGVMLAILRYVTHKLCASPDTVKALLGGKLSGSLEGILKRVAANPDDAVCAIVEIFNPVDKYDMYKMFTQDISVKSVVYSDYWTKEQAAYVSGDLDGFINTAVSSATGKTLGELIKDLLGENVFNSKTINKLVISLRKELKGLGDVMNLMKIDTSMWNDITEDYDWGFKDGDKEGFVNALVKALSPFNVLLKMLFADEDLAILDNNVRVIGYEGYAYGIIPILEAFGCDSNDIASPEKYLADIKADESAILKDILVPVINLFEKIYNEPVNTLLEILPNVIYFIQSDNFDLAVRNTAKSVFVLLDNIDPIIDINFPLDFSFEGMVKLICSSLGSSDNDVFIKDLVKKLDIQSVLQGEVKDYVSKNGLSAKKVVSTNADTMTAVLRSLFDLIFAGDNNDGIEMFVLKAVKPDAQTKNIIHSVFKGLDDMYGSSDGTDKILSLVYYIYSVGTKAITGDMTVVADLLNRWTYIEDMLSKTENEYIVNFLKTVADGFADGTVNITNTQSTNIKDTYYIASTFGINNVTDGKDFSDTVTKHDPENFVKDYSLTHQQETDTNATLIVDKSVKNITDLKDAGMHISAVINAYSAKGIKATLSLLDTSADISTVAKSVTVKSANGVEYTYTLDNSSLLAAENNGFASLDSSTENVFTAVAGISGKMPGTGDSVTFRVAFKTVVLGNDGKEYTNVSYTDLTVYSVDKTELKNAIEPYAASEKAYTSDSYTPFKDALSTAKKVSNSKSAMQDAIDSAAKNLADTRAALTYSDTLVEAVNNTVVSKVTKDNYAAVKKSIENAEKAFKDAGAIPEKLSGEIIDTLNASKNAYNAYQNSFRADQFKTSTISYPERSPLANDVARNKNEIYRTDNDTFNVLVKKLDYILGCDDFRAITGLEKPLGDLLVDMLEKSVYNDKTVNQLVKALYPSVSDLVIKAIKDNGKFEVYGETVDLTEFLSDVARDALANFSLALFPNNLADVLEKTNANNAAVLRASGNDWSKVDFDKLTWNVTDLDSLLNALGSALSGIEPVISAALSDNDFSKNGTVYSLLSVADLDLDLNVSGIGLYDKVLLPLLETFCKDGVEYTYNGKKYTSLLTPKEFDALTSTSDMLAHIVCPLLTSLTKEVNTQPVKYLTGLLPDIASFFRYDLISDCLDNISTVISLDAGVDIYGSVFNENIAISVGELLGNSGLDFSNMKDLLQKIVGNSVYLPDIDVDTLATLGTLTQKDSLSYMKSRGFVTADSGAVLATVLDYAVKLLGDKRNANLVSGDDTVAGIIKSLSENGDSIISALNELVVPAAEYEYNDIFTGKTKVSTVKYSSYWTSAMAKEVTNDIDGFANQITTLFGAKPLGDTIKEALSDGLYTNKNLTSAVIALRDVLTSVDKTGEILKVARIDISSWIGIQEGHDWGFKDGDKDGFVNAAVKTLRPLYPVLECLLANGDYYLMNYSIAIQGGDGYKTGVIPLLEAIGCDSKDIVTSEKYSSDLRANQDNIVLHILNPILNLLEKVYDKPIETLLTIIPNLAYFIKSGAVDNALENLLHAVYVLLDTVRPIYDVDLKLDISTTVDSLIRTSLAQLLAPYGMEVPETLSLSAFVTGETAQRSSKMGLAKRTVLTDKQENTFTQLLRTVIDILFYKNNASGLKNYLATQEGMTDSLKQLVGAVIDGLNDIHKQTDGTDKILGMLYKIYTIGNTYFETGSVKDTVLDNWIIIVRMFTKADETYIRDFILKIYPNLCDYVKDATGVDIGAIMPPQTITFWMKVRAFFQKILEFFQRIFGIKRIMA